MKTSYRHEIKAYTLPDINHKKVTRYEIQIFLDPINRRLYFTDDLPTLDAAQRFIDSWIDTHPLQGERTP